MRAMSRRVRRQVMYGWIKWVPVLFVVFSVLYVDAWLNTETRNNDYDLAKSSTRIREIQESINAMRAEEAYLEGIKRLALLASEIGMVEPQPEQIQVVRYATSDRRVLADDVPMALARLEQRKLRLRQGPERPDDAAQPAESVVTENASTADAEPDASLVQVSPGDSGPAFAWSPVALDIPRDDVAVDADLLDASLSNLLADL
jgi:hypothetical protein